MKYCKDIKNGMKMNEFFYALYHMGPYRLVRSRDYGQRQAEHIYFNEPWTDTKAIEANATDTTTEPTLVRQGRVPCALRI